MKKNIFSFLIKAYQKPRMFMHIMAVKYRQLIKLSFIAILSMATFMTIGNAAYFNQIAKGFSDAVNYLPNYHYSNGELALSPGEKPLYYQSEIFQLIIDDTVEINSNLTVDDFDSQKQNAVSKDKLISLYLFKNKTYFAASGTIYQLGGNNNRFFEKEQLSQYLSLLMDRPIITLISLWVSQLILMTILYLLQSILITLLLSSINFRLSQPLGFQLRLKLTIVYTFVPIIIFYFFKIFFPYLSGGFFLLSLSAFYWLNLTISDHTDFLRETLSKGDFNQLLQRAVEQYEELDYIDHTVQLGDQSKKRVKKTSPQQKQEQEKE